MSDSFFTYYSDNNWSTFSYLKIASLSYSQIFDDLKYPSDSSKISNNSSILNSIAIPPLNVKSKMVDINTGIMPPGVLYVSDSIVIYEKPPTYQNIFVAPYTIDGMPSVLREQNQNLFRIPIPWQIYIARYYTNPETGSLYTTSVNMYFMDSQLTNVDQILYLPPLSNFYSDGSLCRPFFSSMDDVERYPNNIAGIIESSYDWIWSGGSNLDLTQAVVQFYIQSANASSRDLDYFTSKNSLIHQAFNHNKIPRFSPNSYYTDYAHYSIYLKFWENISIDNITSYFWPNPSLMQSYNYEYEIIRENHSGDYITQLYEEGQISSDEYENGEYDINHYDLMSYYGGDPNLNQKSFYTIISKIISDTDSSYNPISVNSIVQSINNIFS